MSWLNKEKVVVPVDFSEFSLSAVGIARDFVEHNRNLHVIHVVREINPRLMSGGMGKEYVDERFNIAQRELESSITNEYPGINVQVKEGEPGEEIADFAASIDADLIVLTSHGRRGIRKYMLGCVAERVLRLATCSVLVVKPHLE